ncbi:hypothetical protein HER21_41700, partial [Pseudomonas sp. BGM005]|nr:hypothetical protein [Pseudomonas sp. BG5]
ERVIGALGDQPISTPALEAMVDIRRTPLELLLKVLDVDGVAVRGVHQWGVIDERTFHRARFEDAVVEVSKRGGRDIVRPLHPEHALRTEYAGTPT